ncbi:AmmeMemoRadiSam system protein B [Sulfurimonas sp.]|uniref:AmmeMemoRadiSam system protein B n=1 Tax=Sulfurimonas sp. TaxID=2022749 RepID=UPI003567C909
MKRSMSVAGSFYPARSVELERYFEHFNTVYEENFTLPDVKSRAVIVPHAGYIYSGYTANIAFRILQRSGVKKFVIIGPSHRVAFAGITLCDFQSYETPFGDIEADRDMTQKLKDGFELTCLQSAHFEHSTEVQFPFLKNYIPDAKIVELVYGSAYAEDVSKIIDFVLAHEDYGVIISTDLSHFYDLDDANRLDNICLEAVTNLDTHKLTSGCEACGMIGVEAMMLSAKKLSLNSHILDYRTSADASGDVSRVVGYMSAYFI